MTLCSPQPCRYAQRHVDAIQKGQRRLWFTDVGFKLEAAYHHGTDPALPIAIVHLLRHQVLVIRHKAMCSLAQVKVASILFGLHTCHL